MTRPQARAIVRPDYRRALVIGFAVAASSLMWSSMAGAQETSAHVATSNHAPETAASLLAIPSALTPVAAETRAVTPSATAAATGPVMTLAAVSFVPSVSRTAEATLDERMRQPRAGLGRNLALVIVGVAAMVIGSDIDGAPGTLMVVGGAGMTLYGLYYILR